MTMMMMMMMMMMMVVMMMKIDWREQHIQRTDACLRVAGAVYRRLCLRWLPSERRGPPVGGADDHLCERAPCQCLSASST